MTARRTTFLFTALGLLTAALFIADLAVGSVAVPLGDVWAALTGGSCDPATSDIILKIRLLKAVTALFAGAALAAGGLEMQTLFRNPLAGPYVLGVSSGAGLGVALFLHGDGAGIYCRSLHGGRCHAVGLAPCLLEPVAGEGELCVAHYMHGLFLYE